MANPNPEADQAARFGTETAQQIIKAQADAGMDPDRIVQHHDEVKAMLFSEATTAAGVAFAQHYADTADTLTRELRENGAPKPAPAGDPHPDPYLASQGWRSAAPGVYEREPKAETEPARDPQPAAA